MRDTVLHLTVALRVTAEGERVRSQAIARRLLRQYDAVLLVYDEAKDKAVLLEVAASSWPFRTGLALSWLSSRCSCAAEAGSYASVLLLR